MQEIKCKSEYETKAFARNLASILKKGDIIVLIGELGSGKTKFTEGLLSYFDLQEEISSPTFTIVNEYHSEKINIYHFDFLKYSLSLALMFVNVQVCFHCAFHQ